VPVALNKGAMVGDPGSDAQLQSALAYLERQVALRDRATSD
jgi:hypothetical protein